MTKQEDIRERIKAKLLFDMKLVSPMISKELDYNANQLAGEILKYLHSEGVVIKVKSELPLITSDKDRLLQGCSEEHKRGLYSGYALAKNDMLNAGYVAVEPLLKNDN